MNGTDAASPGEARGENVILTGIARSGTTLACTLLNRLPRCVALHEPMSPSTLLQAGSRGGAVDRIDAFFAEQRASLLADGTAASRSVDGTIPDNPFAAVPGAGGKRVSIVTQGSVRFDKPLDSGFRLVVKHPSCFTALLDLLVDRFRCVAMVRHPLAVLLSWNTTEANWNDGRQPAAEAFDEGLKRRLQAEPDVLERQVAMLDWSFRTYARFLPPAQVLRYEDLVASGGRTLAVVDPTAGTLGARLEERNASPLYRVADVERLAGRLLAGDGGWLGWYPRESIAELASRLAS